MISPPEQPHEGCQPGRLASRCLPWQASAMGSYPGAGRSRDAACLAADTLPPHCLHTASTLPPHCLHNPHCPHAPAPPSHHPRTAHALPTHAHPMHAHPPHTHPTHAPHAPRGQGMTLVYALVVAITNGSDDHTPDHHSSSDALAAPLPIQRASTNAARLSPHTLTSLTRTPTPTPTPTLTLTR